jgi:hypothetical protein
MSDASYHLGFGAWIALPILTFMMAASAHAGWLFTSWVLR